MQDYKGYSQKMSAMFSAKQPAGEQNNLAIKHYAFQSEYTVSGQNESVMAGDLYFHELVDSHVPENEKFNYPVVLPAGDGQYNTGILLLHGLNEKSWDKYLVWAAELATKLNRPVVLFPIAYHMNRAPKNWSNPRLMGGVVESRKKRNPKGEATFANAALSTRLSAYPELFVYSGIQSYYDVAKLFRQIQEGRHPLFSNGAHIDMFAYSIGAFLAEILFMGNPGGLFTHSRLFIFAGGPTFDSMVGTSRYIMDLPAFKQLLSLRHKKLLKKIYAHLQQLNLPDFDQTWRSFYAMVYQRKGRKLRADWLEKRGANICALILKKDKVMPAKVIVKTLKGKNGELPPRVDIIDFPYNYSHENPFPLNDEKNQSYVDRSFSMMIGKAIRFYEKTMPVYSELTEAEKKNRAVVQIVKG